MQSDELVWQIINHGYCAFKAKLRGELEHLHVLSGCGHAGKVYLYMKTAERAHTPRNLWEKVLLSPRYPRALEQITEHLMHWPAHMVHKCKQRLTKIVQYLMRIRKLDKTLQPTLERVHKKVERREAKREAKALTAAQIEKEIEKELLERLKAGTYGDIYNFPETSFKKALDTIEAEHEVEEEPGEETDDEEHDNLPSDMHLLRTDGGGKEGEDEDEGEDEEDVEDEEELVEFVEDPDLDAEFAAGGDMEDADDFFGADPESDAADDAPAAAASLKGADGKRRRDDGVVAKPRKAARGADSAGVRGRKQVHLEYEHEEEEPARTKELVGASRRRSGSSGGGW